MTFLRQRVGRPEARLAGIALLWLATAGARAEPDASVWLGRPNPLRAFLPSAAARAAERQTRAEALIERSLILLPGVRAARVRLSSPALDSAALDLPAPTARADVMLQVSADPTQPSQRDVMQAIARTLPELAPLDLSLTRVPLARPTPPPPASSVRVGPFWVAPSSAAALRIVLATCLLSNITLAALLLRRRPRS